MAKHDKPNGKFYDPYYCKGGRKKEITTVEEAFFLLHLHYCDGTACSKCPQAMYVDEISGHCDDVRNLAEEFLKKHGGGVETLSLGNLDFSEDAVERCEKAVEWLRAFVEFYKSKSPAVYPQGGFSARGTCETCEHLRELSGVPFCKAWHNFTNPEGDCYLYSAILDEGAAATGKPVENSV